MGDSRRRGVAFYGYLGVLLSMLIVSAAVLWLILISFPFQYYLPASLGMLLVMSIIGYVILSRRILPESNP